MPRMKLPTQPKTCACPCACSQAGEIEVTLSRPLICRRFHTPRNVPGNNMKKSPELTNVMRSRESDSSLARARANTSAGDRTAGVDTEHVAISAIDMSASGRRPFHFDGARKQNVVFEMHVKMEVLLEFGKGLVSRLIARAGIGARRVSCARNTNPPHQFAGAVVLPHHRMDRIPHGLEERRFDRSVPVRCALHRIDERKKNLLFLLHVHQHFARDIAKELFDLFEFTMLAAVLLTNLRQQVAQ